MVERLRFILARLRPVALYVGASVLACVLAFGCSPASAGLSLDPSGGPVQTPYVQPANEIKYSLHLPWVTVPNLPSTTSACSLAAGSFVQQNYCGTFPAQVVTCPNPAPGQSLNGQLVINWSTPVIDPISGATTGCKAAAPQYEGFSVTGGQTNGCPEGAALTPDGRCMCGAGLMSDLTTETGLKCVRKCEYGKAQGSGYYNQGTEPGSIILQGCDKGCEVTFDGLSAAGSLIENGVKNYYSKGSYIASGYACTVGPGKPDVGDPKTELTTNTCASNQSPGYVNDKFVCVNKSDGKVTEETSSKEKTETTTVQNPDGSTTTTTIKIDASGNKTTTITTNFPNGTTKSQTTYGDGTGTVPGATNTGGSSGSGSGTSTGDKGACELNPNDPACVGTAVGVQGLYEAKDKQLGAVLAQHRATLEASPIGQALGGFFVLQAGGSCSPFTAQVPFINTTISIDAYCSSWAGTMFDIVRVVLLFVASFMAFRVVME